MFICSMLPCVQPLVQCVLYQRTIRPRRVSLYLRFLGHICLQVGNGIIILWLVYYCCYNSVQGVYEVCQAQLRLVMSHFQRSKKADCWHEKRRRCKQRMSGRNFFVQLCCCVVATRHMRSIAVVTASRAFPYKIINVFFRRGNALFYHFSTLQQSNCDQ